MPTKRTRRTRQRKHVEGLTPTELQWLTGVAQPDANTYAMLDLEHPGTEAQRERRLYILAHHLDLVPQSRRPVLAAAVRSK